MQNQSEESSKITINAHTPSCPLHELPITWAAHYPCFTLTLYPSYIGKLHITGSGCALGKYEIWMNFLFYLQIYLWYSFCSVFEKDLDYWNIDPYSIGDNFVIRIVNQLTIDMQRLAVLSSTFLRWTSARMRRTWTWVPRSRRWRPRRRRTSGTVPSGRRRQGEGGRMVWMVGCV